MLLVALLVGAAGGATLCLVLLSRGSPETLAESTAIEAIPAVPRQFHDARQAEVLLVAGRSVTLRTEATGVVTADRCSEGSLFQSGDVAFSIDGKPVIALQTEIPLWRPMARDDKGPDVAALQGELHRLDTTIELTARLDQATIDAANRLLEEAGAPTARDMVDNTSFIWLPDGEVVLGRCEASVGGHIGAGDSWAETMAGWQSAKVTRVPAELAPGARVLVVDGERISLDDNLAVRDPALIDRLASLADAGAGMTSATKESVASSSDKAGVTDPDSMVQLTVTADWELDEPLTAYFVPVRAVAQSESGTCISADGRAVSIEVVGAELGQSIIVLNGDEAISSIDMTPPTEQECMYASSR